ncbi:unnamed protein product [Macrosiphum euphorbiae]|uniref:Integrase catalytic domain-containing protein n=1 Tax=Macrosiphum euphorbiae TaxID=13131 RepID=A0AAV0VJ98_9HEMI|nr:unnamed protein product [Macrosiphum euphorbiae]
MALDDETLKIVTGLKKKRGVIKGSLTRIRTFISNFDVTEQPVSLLEFRQEELPAINRKFDDVQAEIELLEIDDISGSEAERERFENEYFTIRSQIQELINTEKLTSVTGPNASFNSYRPHRTQLAPISLPSFDGNIQEWSSFFDIFRAMVHEEDSFTTAQKLYHLRSCLLGPALDLVRSIPISDGNYAVVLDRLKHRYDNKSLVIQSHIRAILDCPRIDVSSSGALQKLYSHVCTHVAALRALDQPVEHWDAWLITIVTGRLDKNTGHGWQLHLKNTDLPKYKDLEAFLASRCVALENSEAVMSNESTNKIDTHSNSTAKTSKPTHQKRSLVITEKSEAPCICCNKSHRVYQCEDFKKMTVTDRHSKIRDAQLCFNCFSPYHAARACRSRYSCQHCTGRHNTLLHVGKRSARDGTTEDCISEKKDTHTPSCEPAIPSTSCCASQANSHVFLSTVIVYIADRYGTKQRCRAILDSGSQVNLLSRRLFRLLQLPSRSAVIPVNGIGSSRVQVSAAVDIQVMSRVKDYIIDLSCYVLPSTVCELSSCSTPSHAFKIPNDLVDDLADPSFTEAGVIDMLIGGGAFYDLLECERISLGIGNIRLQNTKFGWMVTGEMNTVCLLSIGQEIEGDWRSARNNEDLEFGRSSKANKRVAEEQQTVLHFQEHTTRNEYGRFVVRLPLKNNYNELGNSLSMAISRFFSIERKLIHDTTLREEYTKFMSEYINLGHMQEVPKGSSIPTQVWYLPHHAVMKSTSLTTKVRVVFDASARGSNGLALNDVLMSGPTIQEDVFSILVRFRRYQYALTSDVEKMFRQVSVAKEDWDLQRILWRSDPTEPLRTYHLTTVTYSTTPASFLATKCLAVLGEESRIQFPEASKAIQNDFYMDDLMTGSDTEEGCCRLQREISSIMDSAKLPLRKWCSNSRTVMQQLGRSGEDPLFTLEVKDGETIKSLGLEWQPVKDHFQFTANKTQNRSKFTKRTLLSDLNRIFDPLGFISPVLLKGKIFLQQIWAMQMDWDRPLSPDIQGRWMSFCKELEQLQRISIPRKVKPELSDEFHLHGFCDASQEAYGACLYVRSRNQRGRWQARLLCSKTRVAPLKGSTIPRLELCGALLLVELAKKVADSWALSIMDFWFWTDSTIVLGWLNSQQVRLKTYVANRVSQILENSEVRQWHHVSTVDNPADLASRGLNPSELSVSESWWYGPRWLSEPEEKWNPSPVCLRQEELPEQRKFKLALVMLNQSTDLVYIKSDWNRLVRAIAWLALFVDYLKAKKNIQVTRYLTVENLKKAETIIFKRVQAECFPKEAIALANRKEVPRTSKLKSLYPFMQDGIILVGGRLQNSDINNWQKHPIVLPANHRVTLLIFENLHREMLHCGPQALLAEVRRRYWPLMGRRTARTVVRKCVKCIRASPKFTTPLMGQLPKDRVRMSRSFSTTGVDFAGPFIVRSGIRRVTGKKAWICVFICFATRAVHLEIVEDMTSDAFMACLRRFISRRGRCAVIHSDNGTNFVGAQRELASIIKQGGPAMAKEGIEWRFNPPSGPHFGGLWEAAVKSAKYHLKRVMGETKLTLAELNTLICQVEACLNSRPITPIGSDPDEPEALTPAHFLVGGPLSLPPEPDRLSEAPGGLRRWKHVQYLLQLFWRRWYTEYLPQCQVRGKWVNKKQPLKINDIVIIKEDNLPPTKWNLGRITQVHPGRDGAIRVVTVRTVAGTEIKRPSAKLCALPSETDTIIVEK